MRLQYLHSIMPSAAALIGLALAQSSQAAAQIDAASAVRGSLGISAEDLLLGSSGAGSVFILNAGCALLFGAIALMARRAGKRRGDARIPFRPTSNFAR